MSISQNNNRGKFIVFESNAVRLNNDVFPTQNINISLNASLQDALDVNGDLIGYAPNGPIQGSASFSFDLTGALPSYFNITGLSEEPTLIKFNTFVMYGYLQSLKYNIQPYQPITVDADFAFFHGIKYLNTEKQDPVLANFDNTLKTYNGVRSYLITSLKNGFSPTNFTYSFNAERVPYTKVGGESPTRVALENVKAEIVVEGNNLDDYLSIRGNDRRFVGVINELYNYKPIDRIELVVDGKVVDQSFSIDSNSYGTSQLKLIQTLPKNRSIVTIPFIDSETLFTSTTDRVYTLPDFAAVCPNIIRREQPVDGGGTPGDTPVPPNQPPTDPPDVDGWFYMEIRVNNPAGYCDVTINSKTFNAYDDGYAVFAVEEAYPVNTVGPNTTEVLYKIKHKNRSFEGSSDLIAYRGEYTYFRSRSEEECSNQISYTQELTYDDILKGDSEFSAS